MKIIPISEHHLLVFWVQIVVMLVAARLLGAAMKRVGQPAVIGHLAAGLVLGPSLFGKVWPEGARWLFPPDEVQSAMLLVVGWVGIVMLLITTGFETDLGLVRKLGRAAVAVAGASVAVPFALGLGAGYLLPASFAPADKGRLVFALFVAAALSISSLPVIAKILSELNLTRRNFGQVILAAGMGNDVVGWLALGAIASIARSGSVEVGRLVFTVVGMTLFLLVAFKAGGPIVDWLLRRVRTRGGGVEGALGVTLLVSFVGGAVTQALGVEAVLGAFVAGIVLSRSKFQDSRVLEHLEVATASVFAPLFFATAGLRVDLALLASGEVLFWAGVVIALASIGKLLGAYLGGWAARLPGRERLALGVGLNARGALEIVIATVGLSLGVLNARAYTVVVLMAIITSMAAPPLLRALARGWSGTSEEQQRLEREETLRTNVLVRPGRLLVPVQRGDGSTLAAKILDMSWPEGEEATLLSVDSDGEEAISRVREVIRNRPVEEELVRSDDPVQAVVDHMILGYGVVGMGAWEGRGEGALLSPLTEGLLAQSPLPVLLVWEGQRGVQGPSGPSERGVQGPSGPSERGIQAHVDFRRVLVPVVGTRANRAAQELAFSLGVASDAEVFIAHVTDDDGEAETAEGGTNGAGQGTATRVRARPRSTSDLAQGLLAEAAELARRLGAGPVGVVRSGQARGAEIAALAEELDADLVVLSAELQPMAGEPFLGNLVEDLVRRIDATVAVVAAPPQWLANGS
ncbi:MAG: cation:proton antiporter [Actinobacteria bacterium]|nr:cation:proton antiporter [Actinomycetota bacterium]